MTAFEHRADPCCEEFRETKCRCTAVSQIGYCEQCGAYRSEYDLEARRLSVFADRPGNAQDRLA